jgi:hypothetical protein
MKRALAVTIALTFVSIVSASSPVRLQILADECDEGIKTVMEAELLRLTKVTITNKEPSHSMSITCYWKDSPPGSTSMYSSWGNADLTIRIEDLEAESVVPPEKSIRGRNSISPAPRRLRNGHDRGRRTVRCLHDCEKTPKLDRPGGHPG